jgi:hypothetical protein
LVISHSVKSRSVIGKLKSFKDKIKSIRPQTVVGFITVPTLSFRNYQDFRITEKYHKSKANIGFSHENLQNDQRKLDVELIGLNADIKLENSRKNNRSALYTVESQESFPIYTFKFSIFVYSTCYFYNDIPILDTIFSNKI